MSRRRVCLFLPERNVDALEGMGNHALCPPEGPRSKCLWLAFKKPLTVPPTETAKEPQVILINSSPKNALKIFQPFLPIAVPIGLGCLAAVCEEAGIDAVYLDEQLEEDMLGAIEKALENRSKPYIFGFSVLTAAMRAAVTLSEQLHNKYPDSVIVFGGVHPTAVPEEVLRYSHIDIVVRGEGEDTLLELYRRLKNRESITDISGLSYRANGKIVHNPVEKDIVDITKLPSFPYHLFSSGRYDLGFIVTSRGCPYNCIFCSNRITTGKKFRFISNDLVIKQLGELYEKHNQTVFMFLDDNFLVDKKRLYDLFEKIKQKGWHKIMRFSCQGRGDNIDRPLLEAMYEAGFKNIFFGIETASERLMATIKKGETVQEIVDAVNMAKDVGLFVSATFIFGLPTETHEDRMDAIRLAKRLRLDQVRFNNATPYPGTELYDIARSQNRLMIQGEYDNFSAVSTFIESPFNPVPFSYCPPGSTEAEIRDDILFAYLAFYWDYKKLIEIFTKPGQGAKWFSAGSELKTILMKVPALIHLFSMMGIKISQMFWHVLSRKNKKLKFKEIVDVLLHRF